MKTAIVTAYDPLDFGNRLQNYAMHVLLSELGLECETLVPKQNKKTPFRKRKEQAARELFASDPLEAQTRSPGIIRQIRFEDFEEQYLPVRKPDTLTFGPQIAAEYRWIVTGGDGVWDPHARINLGKTENNLLAFARSGQRICLAPTVETDRIPDHMYKLYHEQWNRFPWLNVRSREDARLIHTVTGRDALLMEDPILLVDPSVWRSVMAPLPGMEEQDQSCLAWITDPAALPEHPEELWGVDADQICWLGCRESGAASTAGPRELLYLMQQATAVMTDSYFGAVLALALGKPFFFLRTAGNGQLVQERKVRDMLQIRDVSWTEASHGIRVSGGAKETAESLARKKESMDLLRQMFRLETEKTG